MANKHMERCSISLVVPERPNDSATRYHYAPSRRAKSSRRTTAGVGKDAGLLRRDGDTSKPPRKATRQFLKKLNVHLHATQSFRSRVIPPTEMEARAHTWTRRFLAASFVTLKVWKQPECPSAGEWTYRWWHVRTMEHRSARKRHELPPRHNADAAQNDRAV